MAPTTSRLVDGVTHQGLADASPANVRGDVHRLDLRDEPSPMRQLPEEVELERADDAAIEPGDVEGAARIGGDVVERVEIRLEGAVARGLRMRPESIVPEKTQDGGNLVAGREADEERGENGLSSAGASSARTCTRSPRPGCGRSTRASRPNRSTGQG
jgi:hypothetical protein